MNGTVIRGTPIAVDFWKIRESPTAKVFFLTHLHGDHIVGLSSSWRHVIHCSPLTGELLTQLYGIDESLIQPLEVGTSHILDLDNINCEKMSVSVIDANHCPGSVMFLFEGYFGRILHTGDFRFCDDMINQSNTSLFNDIDLLYLDNTYCSPQCVFPSRDSALDEILSIIKSHPHHTVVIGMRNLGKEDMLANIALKCKDWISIPDTMMRRIELLKLPNVFVVDDDCCRIRVVKFHAISKKNMELWNKVTPTIAILPTALYQGIGFNSYGNMTNVFTVQYSDHSSYQELCSFVSRVKPRKIIPIVGANSRGPFGVNISDRANMECFSHLLNKSDNLYTVSDIPESVQKLMRNVSSTSSSHSARGEGRHTKSLKARQMKSVMSLPRGVVFSDDSDEEECEITDTLTNIGGKNKKRKRNFSEILDSQSESPLLQKQKMELENCQPQKKETLLNKWLSVRGVCKKDESQHHQVNRPLLFKASNRNSSKSKTPAAENYKLKTAGRITTLNSQEEADDTSSDVLNVEVKQDGDVEDVIILDDTSSDSTSWSQSQERGANSTVDYLNFFDDSGDFVTTEQEHHATLTSSRNVVKDNCDENSFREGDHDHSITDNYCNLSDKTRDIHSDCLHIPDSGLPGKPIGGHVMQATGYVSVGQSDQVCSHKPVKQHVVKSYRQSSEPKPPMKFSVKPLMLGRKTTSRRLSSGPSNGSLFSVMPLCLGRVNNRSPPVRRTKDMSV